MATSDPTAPPAEGAQNTALVRRDTTPLMKRDPMGLAEHFARSGFFADARDVSKAVVKIVAGEELGLGPMASMRGVHIIEGAPSLSANVLATLVKRSERYDYKVRESTGEKCSIEFFEDGESLGLVSFTIEQAAQIKTKQHGNWISLAETLRWQNSPVDMLFARCLTRGVRQHCPDVTAGTPAYTPDELGAETDARGEPVFVESTVEAEQPQRPEPLPDETVDQLMKGYEIAGPELGGVNSLDGLNLVLGSLGIDSFEPDGDLREQFATLTPEQAEAVQAEFNRVLDQEEEEVADAEVVEDSEGQTVAAGVEGE